MGTNYFAAKQCCERCGTVPDLIHIGKSAAGWPFMFRADEKLGAHDWPTWRRALSRPGLSIQDEYGRAIGLDELNVYIVSARIYWDSPLVRNADGIQVTLDGDLVSTGDFR